MLQWEKTRNLPGKEEKNNPEIYREGGEKYPENFPVRWIVVGRAHYWTCKFTENLFAV
jgi:hypothetical protein